MHLSYLFSYVLSVKLTVFVLPSSELHEGELISQWIACKCGFSTIGCDLNVGGWIDTWASSHRSRIRRLPAAVVSPEEELDNWRDKLCVQGRLLGGQGERGLEHKPWHLLTQELTPDHSPPQQTGNGSASGPGSWALFGPSVSMQACVFHLSRITLYLQMYTLTLFLHWGKRGAFPESSSLTSYWNSSELKCGCAIMRLWHHTMKAPAHSWNQVLRKCYPQCTFLGTPYHRVLPIG